MKMRNGDAHGTFGPPCLVVLLAGLVLLLSGLVFGVREGVSAPRRPPVHFTYVGFIENDGIRIGTTAVANVENGVMRIKMCVRVRRVGSTVWSEPVCRWTPWFRGLIPRSMEQGPIMICTPKNGFARMTIYGEAHGANGVIIPGTKLTSSRVRTKCGVEGTGGSTA